MDSITKSIRGRETGSVHSINPDYTTPQCEFKIEWLLESAKEFSEDQKRELVNQLAKKMDSGDTITYGGEIKRQSITAFDASVGILLVSSLDTVITLYRLFREHEDSNIGIRQVNNEMFYINEDVEAETIENHGGDVIVNVEGDLFYTLPTDMEQHIELMKELREDE
jgi:hypothetical protein